MVLEYLDNIFRSPNRQWNGMKPITACMIVHLSMLIFTTPLKVFVSWTGQTMQLNKKQATQRKAKRRNRHDFVLLKKRKKILF